MPRLPRPVTPCQQLSPASSLLPHGTALAASVVARGSLTPGQTARAARIILREEGSLFKTQKAVSG